MQVIWIRRWKQGSTLTNSTKAKSRDPTKTSDLHNERIGSEEKRKQLASHELVDLQNQHFELTQNQNAQG